MNMNRLKELANYDPIVRKGLELYQHSALSKEDALVHIIRVLCEQKNMYFDELVKYKQRYGEVDTGEPREGNGAT